MRAHMHALLAWTLTAAFLVTVPVTGGGQCPCRFAETLRAPAPAPTGLAPAQPPACKCCRLDTDRTAPAHIGDGRQEPLSAPSGPANEPCDHRLVVDAVVGSANERPETTGGVCDTDPPFVGGTRTHPQGTNEPFVGSAGSTLPPRAGAHLIRYAHAFRC